MHERLTDRRRAAHDRRSFLRLAGGSALGATAGVLAACGEDDPQPGPSGTGSGERKADVALLNSMLSAEQRAVRAYERGLRLLSRERRGLGRQLLEHEREHSARLARAIAAAGGAPDAPRSGDLEPPPGGLRSEEDFLRLAADLARTAVSAYLDALPKLSGGGLRSLTAAIASSEAEHLAALLGELGEPQIPAAFAGDEAP